MKHTLLLFVTAAAISGLAQASLVSCTVNPQGPLVGESTPLFPFTNTAFLVNSGNSGGTISTSVQIRRLPFSQNEYNTNNTEVQKAIQLLSTPVDNGGTRLWWDVNKGNF